MSLTQQQMIELVQEEHPGVGEVMIRKLLNLALLKFSEETRILDWQNDTTALEADKRYYPFTSLSGITDADDVLGIVQVDFDDEPMYHYDGHVADVDTSEAT